MIIRKEKLFELLERKTKYTQEDLYKKLKKKNLHYSKTILGAVQQLKPT